MLCWGINWLMTFTYKNQFTSQPSFFQSNRKRFRFDYLFMSPQLPNTKNGRKHFLEIISRSNKGKGPVVPSEDDIMLALNRKLISFSQKLGLHFFN